MRKDTFSFLVEAKRDERVRCMLCPHTCLIAPGKKGICGVRENNEGRLYSTIYNEVVSLALDPIEKKPLYHFLPTRPILSVGNVGCNLRCSFCQNHGISQQPFPPTEHVPVDDLVALATRYKEKGNIGVAFTYAEPTIWYEYVFDAARALRTKGFVVVLVTNGFINEEPLRKLLPFVDAMNIDLKGDNAFYTSLCKGKAAPVRRTIELAADACHVEVTSLLVTGENDTKAFVDETARFLAGIRKDIPYHLSRYYPNYHFTAPPTDETRMQDLVLLAKEHLSFVFAGNTRVGDNTTYCPRCKAKVIERKGYHVSLDGFNDGFCASCGYDFGQSIVC